MEVGKVVVKLRARNVKTGHCFFAQHTFNSLEKAKAYTRNMKETLGESEEVTTTLYIKNNE